MKTDLSLFYAPRSPIVVGVRARAGVYRNMRGPDVYKSYAELPRSVDHLSQRYLLHSESYFGLANISVVSSPTLTRLATARETRVWNATASGPNSGEA